MPHIILSYRKNTTGEQFDPPRGWSVDVIRWDGQRATLKELEAVHTQYEFDRRKKRLQVVDDDGAGSCEPGGFHIYVARSDGLPLTLGEVDTLMILDMMRLHRLPEEESEAPVDAEVSAVINSPRSIQRVIGTLGAAGISAWFEVTQQLEPGAVPQLVVLADAHGANQLLDAGIIERYDGPVENQYAVPRSVVYCSLESRP